MGTPEQVSGRHGWTRPLVLFIAAFILISYTAVLHRSILSSFHTAGHLEAHDSTVPRLSQEIQSLDIPELGPKNGEEIAHILKTTSDLLDVLSTQYQIHSLAGLSKDLRSHAENSRRSPLISAASGALESRGLLDSLTGLLSGGGAQAGAAGGGGLLDGITSALGNAVSGLGTAALGSLAEPAQYLGDGIGRGVTTGLNVSNNATTTKTTPTGINAVADNLGFGISNSLAGSLNLSSFSVGGDTIAAASKALGAGLGGGAAEGLKLNTSATTPKAMNMTASANMSTIPMIASNLGSGLTQSFFQTADLSMFMGMINTGQISTAVLSAGKGLGVGAAEGLKLPMMSVQAPPARLRLRQTAPAAPAINVGQISEDFTKSLSSSFLGSVDLKALASQFTSGTMTGVVGKSVVGAANGFGSGAATGLGLQQSVATPTDANADAPAIAKNFAYELTTSFLANGTLPALTSRVQSAGMGNITAMIAPAAQGLGSGFGQGAAVGLGLQQAGPDDNVMGGDIAMITKGFSFGLTTSFLANGTLLKLQSIATALAGNATNSLSVAKVAEGAARGLVDGAGSTIKNAGGFSAIINGGKPPTDSSAASGEISAGSGTFDDSVGGAATGFGYGLGAEGVNVALQAFGQPGVPPAVSTATTPTQSSATPALPAPQPPAESQAPPAGNLTTVTKRHLTSAVQASKRSMWQKREVDLSGIVSQLNVTAADAVLQKGLDSLTCQGVGGFVQVLLGLVSSGTISTNTSSIPTNILPNQTFTFESGGNVYKINPGSLSGALKGKIDVNKIDISVNGNGIVKLAVVVVFHVIFLIAAYFFAIPLALIIEHSNALTVLVFRPQRWINASRWKNLIWALWILPTALVGFILGVVLLGNVKQFATPHGIVGLLTFLFTIIAALFELPLLPATIPFMTIIRTVVMVLLLLFATIAFITGIADIQRLSICAVQLPDAALMVIAILILMNLLGAASLALTRFFLGRWLVKVGAVNDDMRGALLENQGGDRSKIEIKHLGGEKIESFGINDPQAFERR